MSFQRKMVLLNMSVYVGLRWGPRESLDYAERHLQMNTASEMSMLLHVCKDDVIY